MEKYIKHLKRCEEYLKAYPEAIENEQTRELLDIILASIDHFINYIDADTLSIPLTDTSTALIDKKDGYLLRFHWYKTGNNSAQTMKYKHEHEKDVYPMLLHRAVMERSLRRYLENNERIGFIDNNTLNCKRENLYILNKNMLKLTRTNGSYVLYSNNGKTILVDKEDEDLLQLPGWSIRKDSNTKSIAIVRYTAARETEILRRLIMQRKLGVLSSHMYVAHLDNNYFNHHRNNLVLVTEKNDIFMKEYEK